MPHSFPAYFDGRFYQLFLDVGTYENGRLAVQVLDEHENCWTVSVNMPQIELGGDEFVFKTYSENEGLLEAMRLADVIEVTERSVDVGFAGPQPICRLICD